MNNIPAKALAIGFPIGLLLTAHLKSLPFAYTLRSWFLIRAVIKRAKENGLNPDRNVFFNCSSYSRHCQLNIMYYSIIWSYFTRL